MLLCSDTHFTDSPTEEYRWKFLEETLPNLISEHQVDQVWNLGDLTDRRDRHSSILVNRLVSGLKNLRIPFFVIMGNHDAPLSDRAYWSFLSTIANLKYISERGTYPMGSSRVLILPYSPNPVKDWIDVPWGDFQCIMMHQTVDGAIIERGRKIEGGHKLPLLPRGIPIYSGDVHKPQKVGPITYVGAPYPTRFGEDWPCRVLLIDSDNFANYQEIPLSTIKRTIVDLNPANLDSLTTSGFKPGDQVRIRYALSTSALTSWAEDENKIRATIQALGADLLSVEVIINEEVSSKEKETPTSNLEEMSTEDTLRLFCKEEGLPEDLLTVGLQLVQKTS